MNITIRRAKATDKPDAIAEFLRREFTDDPTTGANPDLFTREEVGRRLLTQVYWVAKWRGEIVGILEGQSDTVLFHKEREYKGWLHMLLQVKRALGPLRALEVADRITVFAANDRRQLSLEAPGGYCIIQGPTDSPGSRYCRDFLNMPEEVVGNRSRFVLPLSDIDKGPNSRGIRG